MQSLLVFWEGTDAIFRPLNRIYTPSCVFTIFKKIEKPSACQMQSVIRCVDARNLKPADILHQLFEVYEEHAMSDSVVQRWVRHFNEGCKNVHDDPWSSQPSFVNEDLVPAEDEKIKENR
jgi:hypothetical protein